MRKIAQDISNDPGEQILARKVVDYCHEIDEQSVFPRNNFAGILYHGGNPNNQSACLLRMLVKTMDKRRYGRYRNRIRIKPIC